MHVTCSCILHAYILYFISYSKHVLCFLLLPLSLSLSLSRIDCVMAPKQRKSTLLGTPFKVPSHHLLFHLTSGFVMRRPRRTSLRTSKPVAFIRNARSLCRILLTLLSPKSFGLGIGLLYLRNPRDVPSCLYKSFTPTYMVLIPLCLSLLLHLEVHVL